MNDSNDEQYYPKAFGIVFVFVLPCPFEENSQHFDVFYRWNNGVLLLFLFCLSYRIYMFLG